MRILIEEYVYSKPEILNCLKEVDSQKNEGKVPFVGYAFSRNLNDCVFFLPKVILDTNGKVFGKYTPEELWDVSQEKLKEQERFLETFPIWIYQAINLYNRNDSANSIVRKRELADASVMNSGEHVPFLENIIELVQFAKENKAFLLFKMQHLHGGQGRINWQKTITRQQPYLKKGKAPIYPNLIIRKKDVDYEEDLLVIFFSVLRYINYQYGFSADINLTFNLIPEAIFEDYLHGEGSRLLRSIRYKYFSDRTLRIWHLCYAFFSQREKINSSITYQEFLLANRFDRVFEAMVDNLIGLREEELPPYIKKEQEDGKIIDHIFSYTSLTDPNKETFYLVDSKYYPTEKEMKGSAFFKQFTYARNLRQEIMSAFLSQSYNDMIFCLDEKTEGYDIIPNFFVGAFIDNKFNYDNDEIRKREKQYEPSFHFPNRLFDRETLWLLHYDINFLYVLKQYVTNHGGNKDYFRQTLYKKFRDGLLKRLNDVYDFYVIKPNYGKNLEEALNPIFRLINGKIFCPKRDGHYNLLILALEKADVNTNHEVITALTEDFILYDNHILGDSLEVTINKHQPTE